LEKIRGVIRENSIFKMTKDKIQKQEKTEETKEIPEKPQEKKKDYFSIVRIMQTDIPGNKSVLVGLRYIKGISWGISNALCKILKIDCNKKIAELNEKEIETITEFFKEPKLPKFLQNRRNDFETGEDTHLVGTNLDMKREFDVRRLKKIRSYRGLRHALGLPTRGQSTRSHFRSKKRVAIGVKTKK
jgi:small subunit ribosomal protein S13